MRHVDDTSHRPPRHHPRNAARGPGGTPLTEALYDLSARRFLAAFLPDADSNARRQYEVEASATTLVLSCWRLAGMS